MSHYGRKNINNHKFNISVALFSRIHLVISDILFIFATEYKSQ